MNMVSQSQPILAPKGQPEAEPSAAHTSGNHKVEMSLYQGYSSCVYVDNPNGTMRTLAEVRNYRDALLYAAAPDMLEALKALMAASSEEEEFFAYQSARAAIAKTEGRS